MFKWCSCAQSIFPRVRRLWECALHNHSQLSDYDCADVSARQGNSTWGRGVLSNGRDSFDSPIYVPPLANSIQLLCTCNTQNGPGSPYRDGSLGKESNPRDDAGRKLGRERGEIAIIYLWGVFWNRLLGCHKSTFYWLCRWALLFIHAKYSHTQKTTSWSARKMPNSSVNTKSTFSLEWIPPRAHLTDRDTLKCCRISLSLSLSSLSLPLSLSLSLSLLRGCIMAR